MNFLERRHDRIERKKDRESSAKEASKSRRAAYIAACVGAIVGFLLLVMWNDKPWEAAFRVTVIDDPDQIDIGNGPLGASYITSTPVEDLPPVPETADRTDCVGRSQWAAEVGAVEATTSFAFITVEATSDSLVRVTGIELVVDERRPPLPGIHLTCGGKGEQNQIRTVSGDLDAEPPTATFTGEGAFNFDVSPFDSEVFLLTATTLECDCTWHAELQLEVDGAVHAVRVPEEGSYRTASPTSAADFVWREGEWTRPIEEQPAAIPAPNERACLVDKETVATAYQEDFTTQGGVTQETLLGETPMLITTCSYDLIELPAEGYSPIAVQLWESSTTDDLRMALEFFETQIGGDVTELDPGTADRAALVGPFYIGVVDSAMVVVQGPTGTDMESVGASALLNLAATQGR